MKVELLEKLKKDFFFKCFQFKSKLRCLLHPTSFEELWILCCFLFFWGVGGGEESIISMFL